MPLPQNALTDALAERAEEDEGVFPLELDDQIKSRQISVRPSCPVLSGTASRLFAEEDTNAKQLTASPSLGAGNMADMRASIHGSVQTSDRSTLGPLDCLQPPARNLNRKRSILLADVIDDVEGRQPRKRLATQMKSPSALSATSASSIAIARVRRSPRILRPKASQFDLLYQSSKQQSFSSQKPLVMTQPTSDTPSSFEYDLALGKRPIAQLDPPRGRTLRPCTSLLTLRVQDARSASPAKRRLEDIDTRHITSFDSLLRPATLAADEQAMPDASPNRPDLPATNPNFRNAKLLLDLPEAPRDPTRFTGVQRRLRHTKSAKDILRRYVEPRQTPLPQSKPSSNISRAFKNLFGFNGS
jgi:hypothetical protein